jgi:hypothetical protein
MIRCISRLLFLAGLVFENLAACPLCHSETGILVRAGIFDAQFTTNVLYTLSPFPVFLLIVWLIYYHFPTRIDEDSECPDR